MKKSMLEKRGNWILLCCLLLGQSLLAQVANPVEIAMDYLDKNAKALNLTKEDLSNIMVKNQVLSKHNKVTHLYLYQQYEGVTVHNAIINMNIMENGKLLSMGNRFVSDLANQVNTTSPVLSMEQAITALMTHFNLDRKQEDFQLLERLSEKAALFDPANLALEPIKVELVYQPLSDQSVRLAWNITFYELGAQNWWNARIDAVNGSMLDYYNHVIHCSFEPSDEWCTEEDHHHHIHAEAAPALPPTSNAYRVFPLLTESPSHGTRTLEVNPAEPISSPFGWHDTNGEPGHEFTITRGNNVHAYHDIFDQNFSTGNEPDGGDSLVFDFPLDLALNRPYVNLDAATTNLFYWNNLVHDVWYHYGFDEQAGNFQANNYGNGGNSGDYVRAEALDGSGTNNANFSTPPDGNNPRMQMYLWGGSLEDVEEDGLKVLAPDSISGTYEYIRADFGGDIPAFDMAISGKVVLANDSIGNFADACESIMNSDSLAGKIAMIDRGDCQFGFKSLAAQNAGAVAVIICNNVEDEIIAMGPGDVGDQVNIPAIMVSLQDCNRLKMGLPGLEVRLSQLNFTVPLPGPSGRDSDFDNGVIVHEYTHGISNRLTGGPDAAGCLNSVEQAGEGWSDWFGLVMTTTPEMTAEQARGIGTYADGQQPTGDGIRTYPYSRDMFVNPHTYGVIEGETQVHFIGSVWCAMIWDLFWNLVDEYGYDPDLYYGNGGNNLAMQLVVDGLKMQPCGPSFIDSRDAILKADSVNNGAANACLIWETFARRGLGLSAQEGGIEAFDTPLLCLGDLFIKKSTIQEANAGQFLSYEIQVVNGSTEDFTDGIVTDQLPEGTTFVSGSANCDATIDGNTLTLDVGVVPSGTIASCRYQIRLPNAPFSEVTFEDGIETGPGNWIFEHTLGVSNWKLTIADANNGLRSLFATNEDDVSDQRLIIEEPFELSGPTAGLSFWHRFDVEEFKDGGVVEISTDGTTWEDLGDHILYNGYNATLADGTQNPLSGRPAFTGNSNEWIQTIIDLSDFDEGPAQIRFRLGCDESRARLGWYVDDIRFYNTFETAINTACLTNDGEETCEQAVTILLPPLATSTLDIEENAGISLFPNPTNGSFTIQMTEPTLERVTLRVTGMDGRHLLQRQYNGFQSEEVNLTAFGAGVYMVELQMAEKVIVRRVVVE